MTRAVSEGGSRAVSEGGYIPRAPIRVMTSGVFDVLHAGHLSLLYRARALGDLLIVGVVSDAGAVAYKGRAPVQQEAVRVEQIQRLGLAHVVVLQETTDPTPLLERFLPDVYAHADGDGAWSTLRERAEAKGARYVNLPYTPDISSTLLRERAVEGRLQGRLRGGLGGASSVASGVEPGCVLIDPEDLPGWSRTLRVLSEADSDLAALAARESAAVARQIDREIMSGHQGPLGLDSGRLASDYGTEGG